MVATSSARSEGTNKLRMAPTIAMLCCAPKKDGSEQSAEMVRSPRRGQQQVQQHQRVDAPDLAAGFGAPQMVVQKDFRKVSGISSEIFRQIETIENDLDESTAAALRLVERRGEMLVTSLDPARLSKKAYRTAAEFLAMEDDRHTIQFVEIVKRPGQTLGLYIREGDGTDRGDGVFISRIALESAVYNSGCLRVGDEVLAVNLVDVTGMGLDDVVIIMSIPRRLVLTTRQRRYQPGQPDAPPTSLQPKTAPVVVMKRDLQESGNDGSAAPPLPNSAPPPLPPRRQLSGDPVPYGYARVGRPEGQSVPPPRYHEVRGPGGAGGDTGSYAGSPAAAGGRRLSASDSWHSDASSVTPYKRPPPPLVVTEQPHRYAGARYQRAASSGGRHATASPALSSSGHYGAGVHRSGYSSLSRAETYQQQRGIAGVGLRGVTRTYSDQLLPADSSDSCESALPPAMPAGLQTASGQYPARYSDTMRRLSALRRRTASLDYASDSEATVGRMRLPPRPPAGPMPSAPGARSRSLPRSSPAPLSTRSRYVSGYGSTGQPDSQDDSDGNVSAPELRHRRGLPPSMRSPASLSTSEYKQWLSRAPSTGAIYERIRQYKDASVPPGYRSIPPTFSAENLGANGVKESPYYSYQPRLNTLRSMAAPEAAKARESPRHLAGAAGGSLGRTTPLHILLEERSVTPAPQPEAKSRFSALNINPAEFLRHKGSSRSPCSGDEGVFGLLWVHLLSGRGLRPAGRQQHLRDLYCVLECDRVHKARTVIRTGDLVFDWDETFQLDLIQARQLDFLIYSWDPQFRHKLCYKAGVSVTNLFRDNATHQLALQVEPHGSLYVKLKYTEPKRCFERPLAVRSGSTFGVDLETVVAREGCGLSVPLLVKRCVEEIERRGLDIIGLYRLCGSAAKSRALRQQLEAGARTADLTPENVPDINVITGVLKDYLRELPEPLFTKCLYQMLCDALSTCLRDDPAANAKLMLSILDCLPKVNRCTLLFLMDHLRLVASESERNKMTPQNLAICFGPVLMLHSEIGRTELDFHRPISILKYLLTIWPTKSARESVAARVAPSRRSRLSPHAPSLPSRHQRSGPPQEDRSDPATTATDSGSESRDSSPNQPQHRQTSRPRRESPERTPGGLSAAAVGRPFPGPPAAPSYMSSGGHQPGGPRVGEYQSRREMQSDRIYQRLNAAAGVARSAEKVTAEMELYRRSSQADGGSSGATTPDNGYASRSSTGDGSLPRHHQSLPRVRPIQQVGDLSQSGHGRNSPSLTPGGGSLDRTGLGAGGPVGGSGHHRSGGASGRSSPATGASHGRRRRPSDTDRASPLAPSGDDDRQMAATEHRHHRSKRGVGGAEERFASEDRSRVFSPSREQHHATNAQSSTSLEYTGGQDLRQRALREAEHGQETAERKREHQLSASDSGVEETGGGGSLGRQASALNAMSEQDSGVPAMRTERGIRAGME